MATQSRFGYQNRHKERLNQSRQHLPLDPVSCDTVGRNRTSPHGATLGGNRSLHSVYKTSFVSVRRRENKHIQWLPMENIRPRLPILIPIGSSRSSLPLCISNQRSPV